MESRRKAARILLHDARLLSPRDGTLHAGDLYLEGDRVAANTRVDEPPDWPAESVTRRDLGGRWILPGFVQAHLHLCQTLFRGWAEARSLYAWLSEVIWPSEAALDAETIAVAAELATAELARNGTTAILDMGTTHHTDSLAAVVERSGLRATLGPALMDQGPDAARPLLTSAKQALETFERFAARFDGAGEGRLRAALCPRFVPSVSDALWRELTSRSDLARFPIHTHAAETEEECAEVKRLTGRSPVGYLAALEGTAGRTCLAHAVWLSDEDRAALAAHDLAVCHCPSSNLKLGSGLADVAALRASGVRVGLGADGAACNNRLDPWQEMRQAAHVAALRSGPSKVDPRAILFEATEGAARAIGLGSAGDALSKGAVADFVVLEPGDPVGEAAFREMELTRSRKSRKAPSAHAVSERFSESPAALLVFAGNVSWVAETWVGGQIIYPTPEGREGDLAERTARARQTLRERITQAAR